MSFGFVRLFQCEIVYDYSSELFTHLLLLSHIGDKSGAQHGAAARAFDCLSLRKYKPLGMRSVHLGDEEPYMTAEEAPPLPTTMPNDIRQKVEVEQKRISNRRKQNLDRAQAPVVDSTYTVIAVECLVAFHSHLTNFHTFIVL